MVWLVSLILALGAASAASALTGAAPPDAPAPASLGDGGILDDGNGFLRGGPREPRFRRARRGVQGLRTPVPRRPARRTPYLDDLARRLSRSDAGSRLRAREPLARLVALAVLRRRLAFRLTPRLIPPLAA